MSILSTGRRGLRKAINIVGAPIARHRFLDSVTDPKSHVLLANTSAYRNLGDHAITMGELSFLRDYFPEQDVLEINSPTWRRMHGIDVEYVLDQPSVVFLHGGGYMGTLWGGSEEDNALNIINHAGLSQCVYFPQTVYYSDDSAGKKKLRQRQTFYESKQNVLFCYRDQRSMDFAMEHFAFASERTMYMPDIALYVEDPVPELDRDGVVLCFRHDEEKVTSNTSVNAIVTMLQRLGLNFHMTDTVAPGQFPPQQRESHVIRKLTEFKRAQLVITDRLHAMIFCAITRTPCIAFNNINGKVGGVHEWISTYDFIRLLRPEDISMADIDDLVYFGTTRNYPSTRTLLKPKFDDMAVRMSQWATLR